MRRRTGYALIAFCASAAVPHLGFAQTANWTYAGTGGAWTATWQDNTNWTPAFPNGSTTTANLLAAPIGAGSGTIVINSPAVTVSRINFPATGTNSNGYTIAGPGRLQLVNTATLNVATGGVATIAGNFGLTSNSTFYKIGDGLLVLGGSGSFSGITGISINGGTIRVTSSAALPSTGIISTAGNGQLEIQNASASGALIFGYGSATPSLNGVFYSSAGNNSWNGNWQVIQASQSANIVGGTTLTLNGNIYDSNDISTNGFTKAGGGTLSVTALGLNGALYLNAGTLVLRQNLVNTASWVDIAGSPSARLDLAGAKLILHADQEQRIRNYLQAGANGGGWNGYGFTSSIAEADAAAHGGVTSLAVGYVRGDQLAGFNGSTASFGGQPVTASDFALMLTRAGDTDLDGDVDINADLANFVNGYTAANSLLPNVDWHSGDFNHDGVVNLGTDFKLFANGYGALGGSLPGLSSAIGSSGLSASDQQVMQNIVASVPEPMASGSLMVVGMAAMGRRRRR